MGDITECDAEGTLPAAHGQRGWFKCELERQTDKKIEKRNRDVFIAQSEGCVAVQELVPHAAAIAVPIFFLLLLPREGDGGGGGKCGDGHGGRG